MRSIVVFSDVDGVLQNPREPLLKEAAAALGLLTRYRIWVVLCSDMTRAEIELIQRALRLRQPFIAECGGAAFIPRGYFGYELPDASDDGKHVRVEVARPHTHILETLRDVAARVGVEITGFSDMSTEDVARECGLPLSRARAAKMREYAEPIQVRTLTRDDHSRLIAALDAAQLSCIHRGRFDHVGTVANCGACVNHRCYRYERAFVPVVTIGLVDASADDHLLPLMDHNVMLRTDESLPGAIDLSGWVQAIRATAQKVRQQELDRASPPRTATPLGVPAAERIPTIHVVHGSAPRRESL